MQAKRLPVTEKLMERIPANAAKNLPGGGKVCLLNAHDIIQALADDSMIIMACNTRIRHVIPGIMRAAEELDAIVAFELARSESDLKGGYTGQTPQVYFDTVVEHATQVGFTRPFFIHADHITVKKEDPEYLQETQELIAAQLAAGYTSFALDASFFENPQNAQFTEMLTAPIRAQGLGLEVEVGEIKGTGTEASLTTVDEATDFLERLAGAGVRPDLLAINNGSKHGNYLDGEEINIDLNRTSQIFDAVKEYGVFIAQHGITGTPLSVVGQFADHGIRKGNVGTHWQNVAHEHLPADLMADMQQWAQREGKNVKMATKPFKDRIDTVDQASRQAIADAAYATAKEYFTAFRAVGSASRVIEKLG
jgi:fructose-bisphosphate aldolase class II